MAALYYAADTTTYLHRRSTTEALNSEKPFSLISSSITSFPAKPTRRKNHLRIKILKTLENPSIPKLPPSNPIIRIDSPPFQEKESELRKIPEIQESEKSENAEAGIEELQKFEELREIEISKPAGVSLDRSVARNSILKYGLWFVGAFAFQTVCAIWVFSSAGTDYKNQVMNEAEKGSVIEVGGNGEGKTRNVNGKKGVKNNAIDSIVYMDDLEMERKTEEIRVMARKAREMERLESKKNGLCDGGVMDGGNIFRNGIEIEVDDRLVKLRKNLKKARGEVPVESVGFMRKQNPTEDAVEKGDLNKREGNGDLLFKKKYKFKGKSSNLTKKPKGFLGSDNTRFRSRNEEKGNDLAKPKVKDGSAPKKNTGKKLNGEGVKSRKTGGLDNAMVSDELSSLEGKRVGDATWVLETENGADDVWWLSLPYALVIVMRRGDRGGEGFYTLKSTSSTDNQISHMVAFEDRRDATNFCYLLQSFFEDLEDFEADVVPLTVKELNEAAEYYSKRVVVVKRGQLKLYAGQPLADAEKALRAMI